MLVSYTGNPLDIGVDTFLVNKLLCKQLDARKYIFRRVDKVYKKLDGSVEIVDYKTGRIVSHRDNFNLDYPSACSISLVMDRLGIVPDYISYYYLYYNEKVTHKISGHEISFLDYYLFDK